MREKALPHPPPFVDAPMAEASIETGSPSSGDASDGEEEDQSIDIKELTLRLLASDADPSSSEAILANYVELPRFGSTGEVLSMEEHQEMQNYFKSMMRAARPVASQLAFDRAISNLRASSLGSNVGSPPRMVNNASSLSPISPGNASVGSNYTVGLDNESLHSGAEDMSIISSMEEGEWLENMTVLERQNIVRQLEAAERENKLLQQRLQDAKLLNTVYKQERNEANDRSAVAEERIREMKLYLKEAKIREYELESANADSESSLTRESFEERDLKLEELIKCKMELANIKDECDKTQQTNQKLEKMLARTKMELAHAKESQEDAEVKLDHALLMQQTALQELNLMRRQSVHGSEAR